MAIRHYVQGIVLILLCSVHTIVTQTATACAGVANGSFVRNPLSCRAYYYCMDGVAHGGECPASFLFEPNRQICHIASYAQCNDCSPYGIQNIAHPTDCTAYYSCVSGVKTARKCGENQLFDKTIGGCNGARSVQCVRDYTEICSQSNGYVKLGDANDCSKYYTCYYGTAYHQSCAPGLYFKPEIGSCTFPEEYNFCQDDGPIYMSTSE